MGDSVASVKPAAEGGTLLPGVPLRSESSIPVDLLDNTAWLLLALDKQRREARLITTESDLTIKEQLVKLFRSAHNPQARLTSMDDKP